MLSQIAKQLEALVCYGFQNGITNEEENLVFKINQFLFLLALLSCKNCLISKFILVLV